MLPVLPEPNLRGVIDSWVNPASKMHTSWFVGVPEEKLIRRLVHEGKATVSLQESLAEVYPWIRSAPALENSAVWPLHVVGLSSGHLRRLALMAGCSMCSLQIRHIVKREERQVIVEALGEAIYEFAIKRAGFMTPLVECIEEPLRATCPSDVRQEIFLLGSKMINDSLEESSDFLRFRVTSRFPKHIHEQVKTAVNSGKRKREPKKEQVLRRIFLESLKYD